MIGAAIAVCCVIIAIVGAFVWFAGALRSTEQRLADARVDNKDKDGQIATLTANLGTEKARGDYQEKRANALDQELDTVADSGDPAGARERVLSRLAAAEATAGGAGAATVPSGGPNPSVARVDGDALAKPGD